MRFANTANSLPSDHDNLGYYQIYIQNRNPGLATQLKCHPNEHLESFVQQSVESIMKILHTNVEAVDDKVRAKLAAYWRPLRKYDLNLQWLEERVDVSIKNLTLFEKIQKEVDDAYKSLENKKQELESTKRKLSNLEKEADHIKGSTWLLVVNQYGLI